MNIIEKWVCSLGYTVGLMYRGISQYCSFHYLLCVFRIFNSRFRSGWSENKTRQTWSQQDMAIQAGLSKIQWLMCDCTKTFHSIWLIPRYIPGVLWVIFGSHRSQGWPYLLCTVLNNQRNAHNMTTALWNNMESAMTEISKMDANYWYGCWQARNAEELRSARILITYTDIPAPAAWPCTSRSIKIWYLLILNLLLWTSGYMVCMYTKCCQLHNKADLYAKVMHVILCIFFIGFVSGQNRQVEGIYETGVEKWSWWRRQ